MNSLDKLFLIIIIIYFKCIFYKKMFNKDKVEDVLINEIIHDLSNE